MQNMYEYNVNPSACFCHLYWSLFDYFAYEVDTEKIHADIWSEQKYFFCDFCVNLTHAEYKRDIFRHLVETRFIHLGLSLLRSRLVGCHATLPQRNGCSEPHSFPFVFVVCLRSAEQTNHIIAKCGWRKLSREKAWGATTRGNSHFCFTPHVAKNRRCSQATIMMDEKKR